ncbi:Brp/Blh family beta-carotene 15,15'-dioxygenase [Nonlabens sp.]|uniref:Brp/Blh family beta-carotene 15,15'-dioxygenase n=1 Tax=Nonlabens sp. TaxID=1888209 RepID=UPI001BCC1216|nr:Brp/Blh family beta-carotene 15,15'-dioxygenase [Nonlabens sp.]
MPMKFQLYNIIMVLSFFALWCSIQIPDNVEFALGYFLILTIGVGHGANDLKIFFNQKKITKKKLFSFNLIYAVIVLTGFTLFFIIPEVILFLFILISGYHFGQEHFERYKIASSWVYHLFLTSYGFNIILTLLIIHHTESVLIINDLLKTEITFNYLLYPFIVSATIMIISSQKVLKALSWSMISRELFYLFILYVLFQTASLLMGFAIYFILWHSIPSIYNQIVFLNGKVTIATLKEYLLNSLVYWVGALVFLALLYYFLKDYTSLFLSTIIAFLGGITFPHVFVMNQLHKK